MNEIISFGRFQCKELTPHKNRGMEITYIEKGMLEWEVEGVAEKVPQGSIFFTLPWLSSVVSRVARGLPREC